MNAELEQNIFRYHLRPEVGFVMGHLYVGVGADVRIMEGTPKINGLPTYASREAFVPYLFRFDFVVSKDNIEQELFAHGLGKRMYVWYIRNEERKALARVLVPIKDPKIRLVEALI